MFCLVPLVLDFEAIHVYKRDVNSETYCEYIREAAKKNIFLMGGPLRLPPPLELNGRWKVETLEKGAKKIMFSLMARPFIP